MKRMSLSERPLRAGSEEGRGVPARHPRWRSSAFSDDSEAADRPEPGRLYDELVSADADFEAARRPWEPTTGTAPGVNVKTPRGLRPPDDVGEAIRDRSAMEK